MIKNLKVRKTIFLSILLSSIFYASYRRNRTDYTLNSNFSFTLEEPFASLGDKKIYISNMDEDFKPLSDDIYISDHRSSKDSNIIIFDSYKLGYFDRYQVLKCLKELESMYPSRWDRSLTSMELEWFFHNVSYDLGHEQEKTRDVDLNNADENVLKFFKNNF